MNVKIDISNVVLESKRLVLRSFNYDDLNDFYEYAKVDGVGQKAGWLPHKNIDESRKILNGFINNKKTFAIEHFGKVIGSIGIEKYDEDYFMEYKNLRGRQLGFVLSKDYWGLGIMPEAVNRVIKYLFDVEKLDFIMCGYFTYNKQSQRVQEKCGFKFLSQYTIDAATGKEESNVTILLKEDYV